MAIKKRYFGRINIGGNDEGNNSQSGSLVYIPLYVRHTLFEDKTLREACNLCYFEDIQQKSHILLVNLIKSPYLVRFTITLQSIKNQ